MTLHGTQEDWQRLLEKTRGIRRLDIGLDWWLDHLEPLLQQLLSTYKGRPDSVWWSQVLTKESYGSGGQYSLRGWLRFLFPYTGGLQKIDFARGRTDASDIPEGYVKCPFKLDDHGVVSDCQLIAGLPGVKVTEDGGVAPCMGWLVQKVAGKKESE